MTCSHVLGLIDAGPFADYPRAHLEIAWEHARQCETCGPALRAATALTSDLSALPHIPPPRHLEGAVLARIAAIDRARAATAAAGADSVERDWSAWTTVLGGVGGALAIAMSIAPEDAMTTRPLPSTTSGAVAMAIGLAVYMAGLLAPVARTSAARD